MQYYAVRVGRQIGIYKTWEECERQVKGYSGAEYKKFKNWDDANKFLGKKGDKIPKESRLARNMDMEDDELNINLDDDEVIAYVDGSFDLATFTYSYGLVYITNQGKRTYSGREDRQDLAAMRNVAGELRGAIEAMKIANEEGKKTLYLHYDYMGIEKWALGQWKRNKKGTENYKKFFDSLREDLEVVFIKVKAHSGVRYNEEADKLAKDAL